MPIRVLVVDDEEDLCYEIKEALEYEGQIVECAFNGLEGARMANEKDYDIVLLDIKMADMDGVEVLKEIRKQKPHTKVIMITASPIEGVNSSAIFSIKEKEELAIKEGADSIVHKPFDVELLIRTINETIRGKEV